MVFNGDMEMVKCGQFSPSKYAGKKIVVLTDTFSLCCSHNTVEAHTASYKGYGGSAVQEFEITGKCVRPDDEFITTTHSDGHKSVLIYSKMHVDNNPHNSSTGGSISELSAEGALLFLRFRRYENHLTAIVF